MNNDLGYRLERVRAWWFKELLLLLESLLKRIRYIQIFSRLKANAMEKSAHLTVVFVKILFLKIIVDKLKFPHEMKVNKWCLVSFSMGSKYEDQVRYARPWHYDTHVMDDGHISTYSFKMGTLEIILLPSKEDKTSKSSKLKANKFLILSKFLKES